MEKGATFKGRYKIIERKDKGGMAVVYLTEDSTLGVKTALKMPLSKDGEVLARFKAECGMRNPKQLQSSIHPQGVRSRS